MELFKNFSIGGIFQSGRRMATPWGSFRRFTNTYKDSTNTLLPFGVGATAANTPTVPASSKTSGMTQLGPIASHLYRKGVLQLHVGYKAGEYLGAMSYLGAGDTEISIMQPFSISQGTNYVGVTKHMTYLPSGNLSTCTAARKAFINSCIDTTEYDPLKDIGGFTPEENYLMSFDGLRPRGAGLPTPWTFADNSGVHGAHYLRSVYATIGMDAELILSPYHQVRLASASVTAYRSGYSAYPATKRADTVGTTGAFPTYRRSEDHLFEELKTSLGFGVAGSNTRYFDKRFIVSFGTSTVVAGELSVVSGSYAPNLAVGDWVMVNFGTFETIQADLWMFKVKTIGASITFEKYFKYLDRNTVTWTDANLATEYAAWLAIDVDLTLQFKGRMDDITFTNLFRIDSYSTTASSGYVVSGIVPIRWDSTDAGAVVVFSSATTFAVPWAGVVSSLMADWYDTTIVKTTFPPVKGITSYKELLVGFDKNAIYFSDISLGGSTEMVSGISNITPFGSEFGDITGVCGSEDFLYFSRERKNYVITGDIAGSSFSITECDLAVAGTYNAKTSSNAWAGQVLFANQTGVYSVNSNGGIKDVSEEIKGLFLSSNRDENLFDKTVYKTLAETRTAGKDGGIFKFFLEDARGFVILLTAKVTAVAGAFTITGSNMLVFNTKESKWYEFECGISSSAEAIYGKIISLGLLRSKEDGVMRGTVKQLLVSQWMTVDVPSLEKQFCQLKTFGEFVATDAGVKGMTVGQQNNWIPFITADRILWNTNASYLPTATQIYTHKKRMDASKAQSTSIIMESLATGSFSIEGMEIEGVIVQEAMKK
jgi:hypothetical protein